MKAPASPQKRCAMKIKERRKNDYRVKKICERKDFVRPYLKTGLSNFDVLRVIDSLNNEGTNSLINERKGAGEMVRRALSQKERHKT